MRKIAYVHIKDKTIMCYKMLNVTHYQLLEEYKDMLKYFNPGQKKLTENDIIQVLRGIIIFNFKVSEIISRLFQSSFIDSSDLWIQSSNSKDWEDIWKITKKIHSKDPENFKLRNSKNGLFDKNMMIQMMKSQNAFPQKDKLMNEYVKSELEKWVRKDNDFFQEKVQVSEKINSKLWIIYTSSKLDTSKKNEDEIEKDFQLCMACLNFSTL